MHGTSAQYLIACVTECNKCVDQVNTNVFFIINEARKCVTTKFTYDIIRLMKFNNMCVTIIVHN